MTTISRGDIEAARDAALLCLNATLYAWIEIAFGWANAKAEGPQAFEEFDRHAQQMIADLDALRRRAEETTPPAVRQAILEANAANPPVEWSGTRYVTAHDATIYIAKRLLNVIAVDAEAPDLFDRWEAPCTRMADGEYMPPWPVQFADIEKEAATTLATLCVPVAPNMDSKSANTANNPKLFPKGPIDDAVLRELACRLDEAKSSDVRQAEVARKYATEVDGNDARAQSYLAALRRLRKKGLVDF